MISFGEVAKKLQGYCANQPGTVVMQARVPGEVADAIDWFCESSGVSRSHVVREALVAWMVAVNKQAINEG